MTDITRLTAAETGRQIESGALNARDVTEAYLSAIDACADTDLIYARVTADVARVEADAAADRAKRGLRRGPLDGVPISWKDLFDTAGVVTEAGCKMLEGRTPTRDATVVARGRRAGAVSLGKTHMTELAFSGLGLNPVTATPPNALFPALAPGGSSSGAAVSVGMGLAAAGIGSDTGGSVRVPSSWNSLVGLKTTHGLLPADGVVLLCESFDTVGPLCRSVEDAALLTAMMGASRTPDLTGATLKGARLLVLENGLDADCRDEPRAAFEEMVERLAAAGAKIERGTSPEIEEAMTMAGPLFPGEAWAEWGETIREKGDLMYRPIRERFARGEAVTAAAYIRGWKRLRQLRAAHDARMAAYDAAILPTTPILPPDREALLADQSFFEAENLLALRNTRMSNLMGGCCLTIPTETPACGFSFMGRPWEEAKMLRLGAVAEALG